jgi:beta-lactamase class A
MNHTRLFALLLLSPLALAAAKPAGRPKGDWAARFQKELSAIDARTEGDLGVYVKRLKDGSEAGYRADRLYYLSSTVKVPVAVALLKRVEEGKIRLDQELTLQRSDYVDGSGEILWKEPGERLKVSYLLDKMLTQSDSTATDMLIRLMGVDSMNEQIKGFAPGFHPFTTLLDVRYGAYGELHPRAKELTNMDFIAMKKEPGPDGRTARFRERLNLDPQDLATTDLEEAFNRFYAKGFNSSTLKTYGAFLERLESGALLNPAHTKLVLATMERMTTGERRLKAGLPKGTPFAQKTGTQVGRMCNVGIVRPASPAAVVVSTCLEGFRDQGNAELTLKKVGAAMARAGVI